MFSKKGMNPSFKKRGMNLLLVILKMYTVLCDKPGSVLNTPQINSFIMISLIILMSRY